MVKDDLPRLLKGPMSDSSSCLPMQSGVVAGIRIFFLKAE